MSRAVPEVRSMSDAAPRSLVPDLYALASEYRDAWLARGEGCTSTFADHLNGTCTCSAEHLPTLGAATANDDYAVYDPSPGADDDCAAVPTCSTHHLAGPCADSFVGRSRPVRRGWDERPDVRLLRHLPEFVGGLWGHVVRSRGGGRIADSPDADCTQDRDTAAVLGHAGRRLPRVVGP